MKDLEGCSGRFQKDRARQGMDLAIFEVTFGGNLKDFPEVPLVNDQGKCYGCLSVDKGTASLKLVLPRFMRENNQKPFSLVDSIYLEGIRNDVSDQLRRFLGEGDFNSTVKSVEVNITQTVSGKAKVSDVLNALSKALLTGKRDHLKYIGPNKDCKLKEDTRTLLAKKNHHYTVKAYDKSFEMRRAGEKDVPDGLLRIEIVMVDRTLSKLFGNKVSFEDILTKESLLKVLREYKTIFCDEIIPKVKKYLSGSSLLLTECLCDYESVVQTIALHREVIIDKLVLKKALKKWMGMRGVSNNSSKFANRYAEKYELPEDVIETLKAFRLACG